MLLSHPFLPLLCFLLSVVLHIGLRLVLPVLTPFCFPSSLPCNILVIYVRCGLTLTLNVVTSSQCPMQLSLRSRTLFYFCLSCEFSHATLNPNINLSRHAIFARSLTLPSASGLSHLKHKAIDCNGETKIFTRVTI